jgi:carboxymethylenebutenolidase
VDGLITLNSKVDDFPFTALHLAPKGPRRGGLVLLHEIWGLAPSIHEDAARWAGMGFEVLAPSLFDRQEPGYVGEMDAEGAATGRNYVQANGFDNPLDDAATCLDELKTRGPVYLIGYCYGGSLAWLAACRIGDFAAVAGYYGGFIHNHAHETPRSPVILHFGREDPMIPVGQVEAIKAAQPDVQVHLYDAGHAFNRADGAAAHEARRRTLAFFEENGAVLS